VPFKSEAQRRYLWANEPKIARDWTDTYGSRIQKSNGGITAIKRKGFQGGGSDASTTSFSQSYDKMHGTNSASKANKEMDRRQAEGQAAADRTNQAIANRAAIKEDIAKRELEKSKYDVGPKKNVFEKLGAWNSKFQKQKNIDLARKRAFQKYKDIEQYTDLMDDYGLSAEEIAEKVAANASYGYDFSGLEKGKSKLGSNIGTSIESFRDNLYDVNSDAYGLIGVVNDKIRPDTQVTALNTLNKARAYNKLAMDPNISKEKLDALKNLGRTEDQINFIEGGGDGGGNQQVYLPYEQILPEEEVEREQKEFAYRFGNNQNVGADVTRASYIFNQGGRVPRAFGGIMDSATGRRAYGLGSIFKSVAKAAKKVLKSDLGKAAIAGAMFYYGGGGGMPKFLGGKGLGGFSPTTFFSRSNPLLFSANEAGKQVFNPMKMAGLLTLGGALAGPAKQDTLPDSGTRGGQLVDSQGNEVLPSGIRKEIDEAYESKDPERIKAIENYYAFLPPTEQYLPYSNYANGGRIGFAFGGQPLPHDPTKPVNPWTPKPQGSVLPNRAGGYGKQRVLAEEGGLMNLGGMEKDYRAEGGFVPIGKEEKADDVPARLSVNEFVFTADAVRNAGGGDIDKGAEVMENMMKNLENGGRISEESQGNTGAQEMFSVSERIGEVI